MATAETIAWERSEPGTGPSPVYEDVTQDKAIMQGWRRDSPPAAFAEVVATVELPYETR